MELMKLSVWNEMKPITLDEMDSIKLMNRIDTKYMIHEDMLPELLERVKNDYRVQVVAGKQVADYQTLYYDTEDLNMYTIHHNGKLCRQKMRTRTYLDSNLSFLEVKRKDNRGRTKKQRIKIPLMVFDNVHSSTDAEKFISSVLPEYAIDQLVPQLYNNFKRITLVNNEKTERLTIDGHLFFKNMQTGVERYAPGFMIVELKQDGTTPSLIRDIFQQQKVFSSGFSKYCLGTILTNPNAKINRFKTKLRYIEKLTKNLLS